MSNPITRIDGHTFLPHAADWASEPSTKRQWEGDVQQSLTGKEDRSYVKPRPWKLYSYSVLPYDHVERSKFDVRWMDALKQGKVAVPYFGRGVALSAAVAAAGTALTVTRTTHGLTVGRFAFIQAPQPASFDTFDVCIVVTVSGTAITLSTGLTYAYAAGTRIWPILFGRPVPESFTVLNSARTRMRVTVQNDTRADLVVAGDDFEDYELGNITSLNGGGYGWNGAWVLGNMA